MRHTALLALALLAFAPGAALHAADEDPPKITEETPYVQTPQAVVDAMLRMAAVQAKDTVIDLGSGDGRIVIAAAKRYGAQGLGIDYDPRLVALATDNARKAGVAGQVRFVEQDIFKTDLSWASVVTMYLLPQYNLVLKPALLALKPGTRIVSHDYGIDDWLPDAQERIDVPEKPVGYEKASWVYFWVVPARVQGRWRGRLDGTGAELRLEFAQRYQKISGTVALGGVVMAIEEPILRGRALSFRLTAADSVLRFSGEVAAEGISGSVEQPDGKTVVWRAQRAGSL